MAKSAAHDSGAEGIKRRRKDSIASGKTAARNVTVSRIAPKILSETTQAGRDERPVAAPPTLSGRLPEVSDESLLEPLYQTVGDPVAWRRFLGHLSQAYGDGIGTLMMHDFATGAAFAETPDFVDVAAKNAYIAYYAGLNPWLAAGALRAAGSTMVSDALLPFDALRGTEFYNDWCRPQNIGGGVGIMLERDHRRMMSVTVLLSRKTMDRDGDLTGRLKRLAPHLLRVAQLNRQFAALEARAAAAEGALDRLATAMLVLSADGQVLHLNPQAERILAAGDGVILRGGRLQAQRVDESQALRVLVATAAAAVSDIAGQPGGVMTVARRSGRRPYEVLVAPISDTTLKLGLGGALVAVFIREPEAKVTTPLEWLRQIYGLTAAEARLMQALLAGDSLDEVAARFAVTRETVRTQLKAIFQKTGATSQGDLIRIGMRSLTARYR
jgi:DNA-binding CsgD family transcriptional regulator/PAS domain-containing protein